MPCYDSRDYEVKLRLVNEYRLMKLRFERLFVSAFKEVPEAIDSGLSHYVVKEGSDDSLIRLLCKLGTTLTLNHEDPVRYLATFGVPEYVGSDFIENWYASHRAREISEMEDRIQHMAAQVSEERRRYLTAYQKVYLQSSFANIESDEDDMSLISLTPKLKDAFEKLKVQIQRINV